MLVDHEGLGHAVDAPVDADAAVGVDDGELCTDRRAARATAWPSRVLVLVVEADDGHDVRLRELDQQRVLDAARHAPRRPDVEQPHLALHVRRSRACLPGLVQLRERERGRGLADRAARAPRAGRGTGRRTGTRRGRRRSRAGATQRSAFMSQVPLVDPLLARARRRAPRRRVSPDREPVAAVGDREEAAQRHQQAAAPDPVDERLDVDAHAPRAGDAFVGHRLAERHVEVADEAACRSPLRSSAARSAL